MSPIPSPKEHPNGYAAFSTGATVALLIYEAHTRLGVDLTEMEAGFIVAVLSSAVLFLRKRAGR